MKVKKGVPEPPMLRCLNCGGKKWSQSAIGDIACQVCNGTGLGGIDVDALVKDWQELKMPVTITSLSERIDELEDQVAELKTANWKLANDASCRANGITPD